MREPDRAREAEIKACSWNHFDGITEGSQGVKCATLEELRAYANEIENGQEISCKDYLKGKESSNSGELWSILCGDDDKPVLIIGLSSHHVKTSRKNHIFDRFRFVLS